MTMADLLVNVGQIFTSAVGMVGTVATTITENPILLIFCILPICGIGVGLFRRLLSVQ